MDQVTLYPGFYMHAAESTYVHTNMHTDTSFLQTPIQTHSQKRVGNDIPSRLVYLLHNMYKSASLTLGTMNPSLFLSLEMQSLYYWGIKDD